MKYIGKIPVSQMSIIENENYLHAHPSPMRISPIFRSGTDKMYVKRILYRTANRFHHNSFILNVFQLLPH